MSCIILIVIPLGALVIGLIGYPGAGLAILAGGVLLYWVIRTAENRRAEAEAIRRGAQVREFREKEAEIINDYFYCRINEATMIHRLRRIEPEKPAGWRSHYSDIIGNR